MRTVRITKEQLDETLVGLHPLISEVPTKSMYMRFFANHDIFIKAEPTNKQLKDYEECVKLWVHKKVVSYITRVIRLLASKTRIFNAPSGEPIHLYDYDIMPIEEIDCARQECNILNFTYKSDNVKLFRCTKQSLSNFINGAISMLSKQPIDRAIAIGRYLISLLHVDHDITIDYYNVNATDYDDCVSALLSLEYGKEICYCSGSMSVEDSEPTVDDVSEVVLLVPRQEITN